MKTCPLCLRSLREERFPLMRDKRKPNSYRYYRCYDCHRQKNYEYFVGNRVKMNAQSIAYFAKHRAKKRKYNRLYRRLFTSPMLKPKDLIPYGNKN